MSKKIVRCYKPQLEISKDIHHYGYKLELKLPFETGEMISTIWEIDEDLTIRHTHTDIDVDKLFILLVRDYPEHDDEDFTGT